MLAAKRQKVVPLGFRLHGSVFVGLSAAAAAGWMQGAMAYSFNIQTTPKQCENLTVSITGSGGSPPYRMLVIPFGTTPLANNIEARRIVEEEFSDTSVSFQLKYPADSQFVVVVSYRFHTPFFSMSFFYFCVMHVFNIDRCQPCIPLN